MVVKQDIHCKGLMRGRVIVQHDLLRGCSATRAGIPAYTCTLCKFGCKSVCGPTCDDSIPQFKMMGITLIVGCLSMHSHLAYRTVLLATDEQEHATADP
jgi:hypothetical protein